MKKKKQKYNIKTERVLPTPEFLQKFDVVEQKTDRAGETRMRVTNQTWLDIYLKKEVITYAHFIHAQRFHSIWEGAQFRGSVTTTLKPVMSGNSKAEMTQRQAACVADYNKIARSMGKITFDILRAVIIDNWSASDWARRNKRAKKAAPELFRIALDELEDVFKNFRS